MLIEVRDLSYVYMAGTPFQAEALKGINLAIEKGAFIGVIGETGSGKSRKLIAPLICNLAKAEESMIIFDIKGEFSTGILSSYVRGILHNNGYNCVFLDFRNLESDGYDLLAYPTKLYREGKKTKLYSKLFP